MDSDEKASPAKESMKTKKKKARWRDQKGRTVLVQDLDFQIGASELQQLLGKEVVEVRLVKDSATRLKLRQHSGLAYVVCVDLEAAKRVLEQVDGYKLGFRTLRACLLCDVDTDDAGRVERTPRELLATNAVTALAKRHGLKLDASAIERMRLSPYALLSKALACTAQASEPQNVSAYALGVLRRMKREESLDESKLSNINVVRHGNYALSSAQVDQLVGAAVSRANGGFKGCDIDSRARNFLREFDEAHARIALDRVAECVSNNVKRNGKIIPKKEESRNLVASPSAFLMGILRDLSVRHTDQISHIIPHPKSETWRSTKRPRQKHAAQGFRVKRRKQDSASTKPE